MNGTNTLGFKTSTFLETKMKKLVSTSLWRKHAMKRKKLIKKWTQTALNLYQASGHNKELAHYLLGHVLHIIQDSYSEARDKKHQ